MTIKIGVDEAGRGPWAGPVFAGITVLSEEQEELLRDAGVTDSKKLTEKKRDNFFTLIKENSLYSKVKYLPVNSLDEIGIYKSTIFLINELVKDLYTEYLVPNNLKSKVLIDGVFPNIEFIMDDGVSLEFECIIKGDSLEPSISAASILAKVKRDRYMMKLHEKFPNYSFDKHKGYGTKLHMDLLAEYGPCEEHRRSFAPIAKLLKSSF